MPVRYTATAAPTPAPLPGTPVAAMPEQTARGDAVEFMVIGAANMTVGETVQRGDNVTYHVDYL